MNNKFKIFLSLTVLYALFIFYLSSQSNPGDPISFLEKMDSRELRNLIRSIDNSNFQFILYPLYLYSMYPDKVLHAILYAGFGLLLYPVLKNSPYPIMSKHALLFAIIIGTLYGASDEFHQSFVPGRSASIDDLYADSIGLTIAQTIIFIKGKLWK
ncbi:MAG: VanZ family protein [Candidatus Methanoperedens sp.]|nr:VanZ family protein [Candidatus Methanoperedens sp.]